MHTSLDFLASGRSWPPERSRERLERYEANRKLWNGEHAQIFDVQLSRLDRSVDGWRQRVGFPVTPNFHRLVTLKTADLLAGESPAVSLGDPARDGRLRELLESHGWASLLYQIAIDLSRYGEAVLCLGERTWTLAGPDMWFPVVSPQGRVEKHVIAWVWACGEGAFPESGGVPPRKKDKAGWGRPADWRRGARAREMLIAQIHEPGRVTERRFMLTNGRLGAELCPPSEAETGLPGFAVIPLQGVRGSDSIFGIDDYQAIDSLVSELMVELGNIARVLDRHASPSMSGPSGALEPDGYGGWQLPAGQYFIRDDAADPEVKYITWDGHLDAAFGYVRQLLQLIMVMSEMGEVVLGSADHAGVTTYRGLKLRMTSALCKVRRLSSNIERGLIEAVCDLCRLSGEMETALGEIAPSMVTVHWKDGLPDELCEHEAAEER